MNRIISTFIFFMLANVAYSSDHIVSTSIQNTVSQSSAAISSHLGTAKDWGLTVSEWNQYLALMLGPSGHYYSNLAPPEVLGIHTDNPEDLRHFAEIAAQLEHDKLEREIRFNNAFHDAATRLYLAEPIIKQFDLTPFTPIPKN